MLNKRVLDGRKESVAPKFARGRPGSVYDCGRFMVLIMVRMRMGTLYLTKDNQTAQQLIGARSEAAGIQP